MRVAGWSVLRCNLRIYHRGQFSASTGPERRNRRSPPGPDLQDRQHHLWQRRSHSPTMDRSSPHHRTSPSHPLRESRRLALLRLYRHARKAVVEPIRVNRPARDRD